MQSVIIKKSSSWKKSEILYLPTQNFWKGYCNTSILYSNSLAWTEILVIKHYNEREEATFSQNFIQIKDSEFSQEYCRNKKILKYY